MEGAGGDKQDVIRFHHAVLGIDSRALNQRQQVSLHAFAGHVCSCSAGLPRDFVKFVEKDDAVLLDGFECT